MAQEHRFIVADDIWLEAWQIDRPEVVNASLAPADDVIRFARSGSTLSFNTPLSPAWHGVSFADTDPGGQVTVGGFTHAFGLAITGGRLVCTLCEAATGSAHGSGSPGGSWTAAEGSGATSRHGGGGGRTVRRPVA